MHDTCQDIVVLSETSLSSLHGPSYGLGGRVEHRLRCTSGSADLAKVRDAGGMSSGCWRDAGCVKPWYETVSSLFSLLGVSLSLGRVE